MNKNCVYYKGIYLDPNSKGYELYIKKEFKELDALIKLLDVEFRRFIKSECIWFDGLLVQWKNTALSLQG